MALAREHALPAAPTSSRSNAIQSSGKPEALQNTAASPPKFGVLALATALDDVGSGTRPLSPPNEFPLRRNPKLRQVGSTPKKQPPRHPSLECWRSRPLWMALAREHALPAAPTSSRSNAIQSSGKPEALQNTAASPPKLGVLALATALDDVGSGTRPPSRSYEFLGHARDLPSAMSAALPFRHQPPKPRSGMTE